MSTIRRIRGLDPKTARAMLTLGSYASPDGTNVRPGRVRLAADCEVTLRTAQRYLTWARGKGLISRTARGNRRLGLADEYRLTLPDDLADRVTLPTEAEYDDFMAGLLDDERAATRRGWARRRRRTDHRTLT